MCKTHLYYFVEIRMSICRVKRSIIYLLQSSQRIDFNIYFVVPKRGDFKTDRGIAKRRQVVTLQVDTYVLVFPDTRVCIQLDHF